LTSESQERMLAIVEPAHLDAVLTLCERWEINASVIGRVTDTGRFRLFDGRFDADGVPGANARPPAGDVPTTVSSDKPALADVPAESLGDGPVYHRAIAPPRDLDARQSDDPWPKLASRFRDPADCDLGAELLALLATPTIADKSWVWRQYDHQLFLNTVIGPGGDASVLRLRGTSKALAVSTDGKARFCALDPRAGGRLAVLEAARNVACAGAKPMALVNCLNFGNPEHPEVMWQFAEVVEGMSEACEALGIPVVGGNVSFYNESRGVDIHPTPVAGVVGLIERFAAPPPRPRLTAGDRVIVLGATARELGGSEWAAQHGLLGGRPPAADLATARALHELVRDLVSSAAVNGVHDCSDGGLAVALAEMAIDGGCGCDVDVTVLGSDLPAAAALFSESASRVIVAVAPDRVDDVLARAGAAGVPATAIGEAGGDRIVVRDVLDIDLGRATSAWRDAIPAAMATNVASE